MGRVINLFSERGVTGLLEPMYDVPPEELELLELERSKTSFL
jgi:nitrogen regulatory protein PII-like uncharacterized protein